MLVADAYPNFSICGLPYYLSGDVTDWRDLAHRTTTDLEQAPTTRSRLGCADWAAPSPDSHAPWCGTAAPSPPRSTNWKPKSPSWSSTLRRRCWRSAGAAR